MTTDSDSPSPFADLPRATLATLPTPLEQGPELPGGARLWVKRDDLTGLGGGGNKARKLEFLCGAAMSAGAAALVTVGAAQSNHCRMTAAAGAVLGLDVHLVLSGPDPGVAAGNQILSELFGATMHHTGVDGNDWVGLERERARITAELEAAGSAPYSIPIGGSTAVGSLGYAVALMEIVDQCDSMSVAPAAIVFTSSSGGTHAGLLAGKAHLESLGRTVPDIIAVGVAKGVNQGHRFVAGLANEALALLGSTASITEDDVEVDGRWIGDDYAIPTTAGDAAIRWAAAKGGWLMDRTYSGKGLSGALGMAAEGRFESEQDVVFIHTGGWPALFADAGRPAQESVAGNV